MQKLFKYHAKKQRYRNMKERLRDMGDTRSSICLIWVPEKENSEIRTAMSAEIIDDNFPALRKEQNLYNQKYRNKRLQQPWLYNTEEV